MPIPAILLITAALFPLVGFLLLIFLGRRLGNPLAGYVGTAFIVASFVCTVMAMIDWYGGGSAGTGLGGAHDWGFDRGPINLPIHWIPVGMITRAAGGGGDPNVTGWLDAGILIDSLTITMFAMITLVATLVHIFSIGYMREDARFSRFFAYLGLFCFSMLALVLGGTLLHILIFWELVGFCSYLLIGFWFEKKPATNAAIKAFLVTHIGDTGLLVGIGILLFKVGNVSLPHLWVALGHAGAGGPVALGAGGAFSAGLLTTMGIALFCGTIGKSAQFPLHAWLADAMEGPTPASALIHAATMVAAGVYLLARIFPILTPDTKLFIAIIGAVTLAMSALIAVAQTDIKKVLAFSTVSQLGYMVLGMGVGSWMGSLFHLMTHAFFKALLFLGAGSVIRAAGHEQELPEFGGLIRKIPVTGFTFLVGVLAISGIGFGRFGFSGFYSKEMILAHAAAFADLAVRMGRPHGYWLLFAVPAVVAVITPFYMMRCWMLTFWGKPRVPALYEAADETPVMWVPLALLAVLAMISGRLMNVTEMLTGALHEQQNYCRQIDPAFSGFDTTWPQAADDKPIEAPDTDAQRAFFTGEAMAGKYVAFWIPPASIGLAMLLYLRGPGLAAAISGLPVISLIRKWLLHRMFFDELYFSVVVSVFLMSSRLAGWFDRFVVDGLVNLAGLSVRKTADLVGAIEIRVVDGAVNGVVAATARVGGGVRQTQSGRLRGYMAIVMIAIALAFAGGIIAVLSH